MDSVNWTRREGTVLQLLDEGRAQRAAADAAGISIKTVELTLAGIREYARTTTTSELVRVIVDQLGGLI